jgi:hypothetical protein
MSIKLAQQQKPQCYMSSNLTFRLKGKKKFPRHKTYIVTLEVLNVCEDGMLIQLLCFWTLSILLFLFNHNISETGLYLRLQVKTYSVGPNR